MGDVGLYQDRIETMATLSNFVNSISVVSTYLILASCLALAEARIIETGVGEVRGTVSLSRDGREFYEWLGIRYAEPPIGKLRFEPPVSIRPWRGVREATEYGSYCPQVNLFFEFYQGSEDCLFLNVQAPKSAVDDPESQLLPVMFFIHGGYFTGGEGMDLRPDYFMDEDIVIVTINYRLNVLGFLNTGDEVVRGNMGLKDQALALKWTYENIKYFGGDPRKITVFGISSGAVSAHLHLISPMSRNYVHKAISQSSTAFAHWAIHPEPGKQARDYGKHFGCPTKNSVELIACLRRFTTQELLDFFKGKSFLFAGPEWSMHEHFVPTIETVIDNSTFLPEDPKVMVKRGDFKHVPWLVGCNSGEGLINLSRYAVNRTLRERMKHQWHKASRELLYLNEKERSHARDIQNYYFGTHIDVHSSSTFQNLVHLLSDRNFYVPQHTAAKYHAKYAPVFPYFYEKKSLLSLFDFVTSIRGQLPKSFEVVHGLARRTLRQLLTRKRSSNKPDFGVCHGDEFAMQTPLFSWVSLANRLSPVYKFSKQFIKLWVQFISEDRDSLEFQGKPFEALNLKKEFQYFIINDEPKSGMKQVPFAQRYLFWNTFTE